MLVLVSYAIFIRPRAPFYHLMSVQSAAFICSCWIAGSDFHPQPSDKNRIYCSHQANEWHSEFRLSIVECRIAMHFPYICIRNSVYVVYIVNVIIYQTVLQKKNNIERWIKGLSQRFFFLSLPILLAPGFLLTCTVQPVVHFWCSNNYVTQILCVNDVQVLWMHFFSIFPLIAAANGMHRLIYAQRTTNIEIELQFTSEQFCMNHKQMQMVDWILTSVRLMR